MYIQQLAPHARAESARLRQQHLRRTGQEAPAKRAVWLCPVGQGTPQPCGAQVQVVARHLELHFAPDSEEVKAMIERCYCMPLNICEKLCDRIRL